MVGSSTLLAMTRLSNSKEQLANFIDSFLISSCRSAVEALEGGQHKIRWVKPEDGLAIFEITLLRFGFEFAIFDRCSPLSTPFS